MWYLISKNDSRIIYVLPGQDIIVGRSADGQSCNFAVPGDPSLSRKHASLTIADNNLNLQDLGSKYGTFINNSSDKLECNQKILLKENDIVKFGKLNCDWTVRKINFVTCTSTLKGENMQNLRVILAKLQGELKSDWDDSCEYLTMPAITLTIKVVLALVQGSNIVTTDYWNKCLDAVSQNTPLPEPSLFTPQIIESTLNKESVSFLPDKGRKLLFADKRIIFFSKRQLEMYKMVLEKSSGTALLLSETKGSKSMLTAQDVIVIQYNVTSTSQETESQREQIKDIVNYLKSKGKRVVADAEIGLAILYCSLEKYCNPDFNFSLEVMKQSSAPPASANNILAPESQNSSQAILIKKENIKIDESLTVPDNSQTACGNDKLAGKRKLIEEEVPTSIAKKMAIDNNLTGSSTGNKRGADSSEDIQTNPSKKMALATSDDDSFNFIKSTAKTTDNGEKILNFMKPIKRKQEQQDDEDGLFNFVTKKQTTEQNALKSDCNADDYSDPEIVAISNTTHITEKVDISALRGSKLAELMEQTSNMEVSNKAMKFVKTEDKIDEDFGSTVTVVRSDLIVKREPLPIKDENDTGRLKNFKKFKKVWPLKIQASMSKLAISA